ncbi:MAG: type II toxin-antitoxin system PemK/MazF family toxin [Methylococcaceae bacterium]|nr:type II toxin-antitoxin system PemK/MazF family toxin [Methylococcaceae bacterium]
MTYNRFDIVKVPFPFTDPYATKNRPALIISVAEPFNARSEHSVMAMITSIKQADWPLDTVITDLDSAGLPVASKIRLKLFTLDHRLIRGTLGQLSAEDQAIFAAQLDLLLGKAGTEKSAV